MNRLFFESNLSSPINSLKARKLLGDLEPVNEKRKGGYWRSVLFLFLTASLTMTIWFGIVVGMVDLYIDYYVILYVGMFGIAVCIYLTGFAFNREQNIAFQNEIDELKKLIEPQLNDGEKFLLLQLARDFSTRVPTWMNKEGVSKYAHFIFTTDRLLIVTFHSSVKGANLIDNYLQTGNYSVYANGLYCVDLLGTHSFKIGGYITFPPILNISHTKCTVRPIGESDSYTWLLSSHFTRNGKLLKIIRQRLKHGYSQEV